MLYLKQYFLSTDATVARWYGDHCFSGSHITFIRRRGMQLYRAEMPGPLKDNKMRPRIAETAKTLWLIYVLLTIVCVIALWGAGMDVFDAISHSFSTVAIGGFSTHDQSIGYFNSPAINTIIAIFC